jgi:hypothetical protein
MLAEHRMVAPLLLRNAYQRPGLAVERRELAAMVTGDEPLPLVGELHLLLDRREIRQASASRP